MDLFVVKIKMDVVINELTAILFVIPVRTLALQVAPISLW